MTRIPYPDLEAAPEPIRTFFATTRFDIGVIRMFAHASGSFQGWLAMSAAATSDSSLDLRTQELAICVATWADSPAYEYAYHRVIAKDAGVTEAQLEALEARRHDDPALSARDQAIGRFADEVVRQVRASDATLAALREHLSDREVVELILVIGLYMLNSRVAENAGVTVDDDRARRGRVAADAAQA